MDVEGDNVEGFVNLKEGLVSFVVDGEVIFGYVDVDVEKDFGVDSGDVFEEVVEEIYINLSMYDISDFVEILEVLLGIDLYK